MKKIPIILCFLVISSKLFAQEFNIPIQNQYLAENPFIISAAYAGIGDCWQLRANGITQWVGIDDSPNTQSLSVDGRINDNAGVGLILFNDSNGFTSQRGAQASYAYHLTLNEYSDSYLSFGLSYKFTQFGIDTSEFNRPDTGLRGDISVGNHNFDVNALYRLKGFFLSLNAINLIDKDINDFGVDEPGSIGNYYVYTGYTYQPQFSDLEFEPSLFYQKFAGDTRATADVNLKVRKPLDREDYVWLGASLRMVQDQSFEPLYVSPMVGIKKGSFYAAYSYQSNLNQVSQYNSGTHMITIGFDFLCNASNCGCTNIYKR